MKRLRIVLLLFGLPGCAGAALSACTGGATDTSPQSAISTPSPSPSPVQTSQTLACTPGWHGGTVPYPSTDDHDHLTAVSAVSSTDVWAVGERFTNGSRLTWPLVAHWDGEAWTVVPSASTSKRTAAFTDVAALSESDVWAVGMYTATTSKSRQDPLVEHFDGAVWRIVRTPKLGGGPHEGRGLVAISAHSRTDIWVLGQYGPAINGETVLRHALEHWDGHRWSTVPSVQDESPHGTGGLNALSVGPSGDVWAVGTLLDGFGEVSRPGRALVERLEGRRFVVATPPPGRPGLGDVDVASATSVWALRTGDFSSPVNFSIRFPGSPQIMRWNGKAWRVSLSMHGLTSVAAASDHDVWAVGGTSDHQPLIEHWNGRRWHRVAITVSATLPAQLGEVVVARDGSIVAFTAEHDDAALWVDCHEP